MIINNRKLSNKFPFHSSRNKFAVTLRILAVFCALVVLTPADDSNRLSAYWDLGVKTVETNFNFFFCFVSLAVVCVWDWNIVSFESISTGSPINTWIAFIQIYQQLALLFYSEWESSALLQVTISSTSVVTFVTLSGIERRCARYVWILNFLVHRMLSFFPMNRIKNKFKWVEWAYKLSNSGWSSSSDIRRRAVHDDQF